MARTFWIRGPSSMTEGETLDAHTARVLLQGNTESVYEEDRYDQEIILPAAEDGSASWYCGPLPVPARRDRDGLYRKLSITPLACGGGAKNVLRCYITPRYYEPVSTLDEYLTWDVDAGTTCDWQSEQSFTPARSWDPQRLTFAGGDESGIVHQCWLTWVWVSSSGGTAPKFSGFRVVEEIDT